MFQKFDYKGGRTFVVGDIHGEFDLLLARLDDLGFNSDEDHLFSVGDLVDRGPDSANALYYLRQPWFHAVRGNHEQMVIDAGGTYWHTSNGGQWFVDLDDNTQAKTIAAFNNLPLAIQFQSPSGKQIGVVHASFPYTEQVGHIYYTDWNDVTNATQKTDYRGDLLVLWDRDQVGLAKRQHPRLHKLTDDQIRQFNVANIDHVYLGHTPVKQSLTVGNMTWLDTGAFATGNLTVVEVL